MTPGPWVVNVSEDGYIREPGGWIKRLERGASCPQEGEEVVNWRFTEGKLRFSRAEFRFIRHMEVHGDTGNAFTTTQLRRLAAFCAANKHLLTEYTKPRNAWGFKLMTNRQEVTTTFTFGYEEYTASGVVTEGVYDWDVEGLSTTPYVPGRVFKDAAEQALYAEYRKRNSVKKQDLITVAELLPEGASEVAITFRRIDNKATFHVAFSGAYGKATGESEASFQNAAIIAAAAFKEKHK